MLPSFYLANKLSINIRPDKRYSSIMSVCNARLIGPLGTLASRKFIQMTAFLRNQVNNYNEYEYRKTKPIRSLEFI